MKKSLLALAVLGAFAGAASAQSSVTIYGLLDQGIAKSNDGTSNNPGSGDSTGDKWALQSGAANRLGFRGVEDLGGGLSAFFDIQHRFTADDGQSSTRTVNGAKVANPFWQAKSIVGLKGGFGTVTLGRDYILAFWAANTADPWGWDTVGQMGSRYTLAAYGGRDGTQRNSNQIAYTTPSFGGFTASVAVALGEGQAGLNAAGDPTLGRALGANLEYKAGPIYAAVGYDRVQALDILGADATDPSVIVGSFAYDFGVIRPVVNVARSKNTADAKSTSFMLGATAPIGNGVLKLGAGRFKTEVGAVDEDIKGTKFAVGYFYNLSKRTAVYADVGTAKDKNGNTTTGADLTRTTSFDLGVKHSF